MPPLLTRRCCCHRRRSMIAPDAAQCADKVALTGELVTKSQDKLRPPSYAYIFLTSLYGKQFQLGTDPKSQRDQIMTEQTNLGLMSALLLTVTFPYFFELQGQDLSEHGDWAGFHEGMLMVSSFLATVGYVLSTIHCVLTMCIIGETTDDMEAAIFADRMGLLNMGSLHLWLFAIFTTVFLAFYHLAVFSPVPWVISVSIPTLSVLVISWAWIPHRQVRVLYDCKYNSYQNAPLILSVEQVDEYIEAFCGKIGSAYLNPDTLQRYIELEHKSEHKHVPTVLSTASLGLIRKLAERLRDQLDEAAEKQSKAYLKVLTSKELRAAYESSLSLTSET